MHDKLSPLRAEIDAIDDQMVALLLRRLAVVDEIAAVKALHALPVFDPQREARVIARVIADVPDDMHDAVRALMATLFDVSKKRQG